MSLNTESGLDMRCRLRPKSGQIDARVGLESMVYVMNSNDMSLIDINVFVHYLCRSVLNKYSTHKTPQQCSYESSGSSGPSDDSMADHRSTPHQSLSQLTLDEESAHPTYPIVMVFDGSGSFNLTRLSQTMSNVDQLKDIDIYQCLDDCQLLTSLSTQLSLNIAFNPNLQLVVIYANPYSIYADIVDNINQILFSSVITVRIVLIVDQITQKQANDYLNRCLFEIFSVQCLDDKQIEFKTNRNPKPIVLDIA